MKVEVPREVSGNKKARRQENKLGMREQNENPYQQAISDRPQENHREQTNFCHVLAIIVQVEMRNSNENKDICGSLEDYTTPEEGDESEVSVGCEGVKPVEPVTKN